jgi:hypothetical protein
MCRGLPIFAVQRLRSGDWLVRAPSDDPCLPAVVTVAVVDESEQSVVGEHMFRIWAEDRRASSSRISQGLTPTLDPAKDHADDLIRVTQKGHASQIRRLLPSQ